MTRELVIAAYDRYLDWLDLLNPNIKITVYRKGEYLSQRIDGLRYIINHGKSGEIYNLASGIKPILFRDIIDLIHKELKSKSIIKSMEPTEFHSIVQVKDMYLDTSKLTELGWKPSKTIIETIKDIL